MTPDTICHLLIMQYVYIKNQNKCAKFIYFRVNTIYILTLINQMRIKQNVRTKDEFEKQNYQRIMQS